jgi:N-acyl homoserine lactone hydrolase
MPLTIHPLVPSRLVIEAGRMTYLRNYGNPRLLPCPFFAILGGPEPVLVDTSSPASVMAPLRAEPVEDLMSFEEALARVDLKPDDISLVILTHLMYDHCANARLLKKARFVVQEAELDYARDPHPMLAGAYHAPLFEGLEMELIQGDFEVFPGLRLLFTPGHSPGNQSVAVETTAGTAIITGFCCTKENFQTDAKAAWVSAVEPEVIPPGIHLDMVQAYESAKRVKEEADIIIPFHDPSNETITSIP